MGCMDSRPRAPPDNEAGPSRFELLAAAARLTPLYQQDYEVLYRITERLAAVHGELDPTVAAIRDDAKALMDVYIPIPDRDPFVKRVCEAVKERNQ